MLPDGHSSRVQLARGNRIRARSCCPPSPAGSLLVVLILMSSYQMVPSMTCLQYCEGETYGRNGVKGVLYIIVIHATEDSVPPKRERHLRRSVCHLSLLNEKGPKYEYEARHFEKALSDINTCPSYFSDGTLLGIDEFLCAA